MLSTVNPSNIVSVQDFAACGICNQLHLTVWQHAISKVQIEILFQTVLRNFTQTNSRNVLWDIFLYALIEEPEGTGFICTSEDRPMGKKLCREDRNNKMHQQLFNLTTSLVCCARFRTEWSLTVESWNRSVVATGLPQRGCSGHDSRREVYVAHSSSRIISSRGVWRRRRADTAVECMMVGATNRRKRITTIAGNICTTTNA